MQSIDCSEPVSGPMPTTAADDFLERIPAISIHPESATIREIARMAAELMACRHELQRLLDVVGDVDYDIIKKVLGENS